MNSKKFGIFFGVSLLALCFLVISIFALQRFMKTEISNSIPSVTAPENLSLVVNKSARTMYLYDGKKLSKTYKIALGFSPVGTKITQGDGATPEGEYFLTHKNAKSKFYLSLGVSFPNIQDADAGLKAKSLTASEHDTIVKAINSQQKPLQNTKLGGDIFLHGGGTSSDWTWGCIALSNEDIKELFDLLPLKTRIRIEP